MELIGPFIYGIGTGFLMSVLLGVIFFMLIQAGLQHHWKKGVTIALGVISGDLIFVILAIGFTRYIETILKNHETAMAFFGGSVLLIMGIATFVQSRENTAPHTNKTGFSNARDFFIKPFVINLTNPANAAWWLGLYSIPPAVNYLMNQKIAFAAGAILTVFFTEVGVAAAAFKLRNWITPGVIKKVDKVVAIALLLISMRLFLKGFGLF